MRKSVIATIILLTLVAVCSFLLIKYRPQEITKLFNTIKRAFVAAPGDPPPEQGGGASGPWSEVVEKRNRTSKTYMSTQSPTYSWNGTMTAIHYESNLDSGNYDSPIDMTPVRVNNAQLDGWAITQNGWHYALGQPSDKTTDGWVGFGGRGGQNWFKFRLARVGYLHWPTRVWDDIGGAPTYNRTNLSSQVNNLPFGPDNEQLPIESVATWNNIWTTPGNGILDISWRVNGEELKEEVAINQEARTWIETNRAPSTPLDETWFGFVFQLDWTNIPKVLRDNIEQNLNGDFADDGQNIELKDSVDRLLALIPLSDAWVEDANGTEITNSRTQLRKRFYQEGGNTYLLVGLRADVIAGLPAGNLIIDPTLDYTVGTGINDYYVYGYATEGSGGSFDRVFSYSSFGNVTDIGKRSMGALFTGVTIPNGSTITTAYLSLKAVSTVSTTTLSTTIYGNDTSTPATPTTAADFWGLAQTSANASWVNPSFTAGVYCDTSSIVSIMQELVDSYNYSAGLSAQFSIWNNGSSTGIYRTVYAYESGASSAPKLHIEYTDPPTPTPTPTPPLHTDFEGVNMEGVEINR